MLGGQRHDPVIDWLVLCDQMDAAAVSWCNERSDWWLAGPKFDFVVNDVVWVRKAKAPVIEGIDRSMMFGGFGHIPRVCAITKHLECVNIAKLSHGWQMSRLCWSKTVRSHASMY